MSSIVEELRTSKRQLVEKIDASRRHRRTNADNNNNNNNALMSSAQTPMSSPGRLWCNWNTAVTPTSSAAAQRRTAQSRSRRRRSAAELCYDEFGALDLTAAKKAVRPSNAALRRPSMSLSAVPMTVETDDSVPLDLSVASRLSYVACSSV